MIKQERKINKLISFVFVVLVLISLFSGSAFYGRTAAFAAAESTAELFEQSNVWDDLQEAEFDGEKIDLSIYNFDEKKNPQIISFIEYCYSYKASMQANYGLYVYVYNPRGNDLTLNTELNQITFRFTGRTDSGFEKHHLKYLNRSEQQGYEGLFYKFKIDIDEAKRVEILNALNSTARIYEVSELELCDASGLNATAYKISNVYTYTGYAKGYGSDTAEDDTLNCHSEGFDLSISLNVLPLQYRPAGNHGNDYTQDVLYSVCFSIPNKILNEYGGLSAVHAQWLNVTTSDIWVTGNSSIFNNLNNWLWEMGGSTTLEDYPEYALLSGATKKFEPLFFAGQTIAQYRCDIAYNVYGMLPSVNSYVASEKDAKFYVDTYFNAIRPNGLQYIFYAENGDASDYIVSSEKIIEHLSLYTAVFGQGDNPVLGKYNRNLFGEVDSNITDINIKATNKYTLTTEVWDKNFWEKMWGLNGSHLMSSEYENIQAIKTIKNTDFKSSISETCKNLYIEERDYEDFKNYYDTATSKGETCFLFRYYQDKYERQEVTEGRRVIDHSDNGDYFEMIDTNAYRARQVMTLGFDIIDVTCRKENVDTVIPCVMSPMDIAIDVTPPPKPTPEPSSFNFWLWLLEELRKGTWWVWAAVVIIGVIAVTLLVKILSLIFPLLVPIWNALWKVIKLFFTGLWWLMVLPFKAFKKLLQKIASSIKARSQRKEYVRHQKLVLKEQMNIERYQNNLNRKEDKRQQKLDDKDAQKAQKAKDKQVAKSKKKAAQKKRKAAKAKNKKKGKGGKKK